MKEGGDLLPTMSPSGPVSALAIAKPSSAADATFFGKGRYKFWALAAILLLAFWSMLTGTVTLKWSVGSINGLSEDLEAPIRDDFDVLEMEEREKLVRHMWDVYTHSQRIRLPKFWQEAFQAAYEELAGDDPSARDATVAEIARMSMRMVDLEPPPRNSKNAEYKKNQRVGDGNPTLKKPSSSSSVEAQ